MSPACFRQPPPLLGIRKTSQERAKIWQGVGRPDDCAWQMAMAAHRLIRRMSSAPPRSTLTICLTCPSPRGRNQQRFFKQRWGILCNVDAGQSAERNMAAPRCPSSSGGAHPVHEGFFDSCLI